MAEPRSLWANRRVPDSRLQCIALFIKPGPCLMPILSLKPLGGWSEEEFLQFDSCRADEPSLGLGVTLAERGQPSPLRRALAGLAAGGLVAVALAWATPIIGKKKFLTVQAVASTLRRLHWFQSQKEPLSDGRVKRRKKTQPEENSGRRRRKKSSQRISRRKAKGRRSPSWLPFLHLFGFTGGTRCYRRRSIVRASCCTKTSGRENARPARTGAAAAWAW